MEFYSIPFINSIGHFFSKFSHLSLHPLFSTIVTVYILILLYAPYFFLRIVLSPALNSTGIILLFLLKLGANERSEKESEYFEDRVLDHIEKHNEQKHLDLVDRNQTDPKGHQMQAEFEHDLGLEFNSHDDYSMESKPVVEKGEKRMEMDPKQVYTTIKLLKWNMKVPLEIIYEGYEDEEDEEDDYENIMVSSDKHVSKFERYPSLSMYYPESETDSSSDDDNLMIRNWGTHESIFSKWEDYDREELIEISLDRFEKNIIEICRLEEDNFIEIDIFPLTK